MRVGRGWWVDEITVSCTSVSHPSLGGSYLFVLLQNKINSSSDPLIYWCPSLCPRILFPSHPTLSSSTQQSPSMIKITENQILFCLFWQDSTNINKHYISKHWYDNIWNNLLFTTWVSLFKWSCILLLYLTASTEKITFGLICVNLSNTPWKRGGDHWFNSKYLLQLNHFEVVKAKETILGVNE